MNKPKQIIKEKQNASDQTRLHGKAVFCLIKLLFQLFTWECVCVFTCL